MSTMPSDLQEEPLTGLLIVHSSPMEGADEDEFNRWYDDVHAPEIVARGAAVRYRRYRSSGIPLSSGIPQLGTYVCVYEIAARTYDDVVAIEQRLRDTKHMSQGLSPTIDLHSVRAAFFLPVHSTSDRQR